VTLRRALFLLAIAVACVAAWQIEGGNVGGWLAVAVAALIVVAALVLERPRYRRKPTGTTTGWRATGERFVDPVSGQDTVVYYNDETGEREYRVPSDGDAGRPG
jgi:hypothetical protein